MARKRKASVSEETFDEFLAEQGMLESTQDHAVKELIAEQLAAARAEQGLTKIEMASRMKTSRRQLDRLFDPAIPSVTLDTLRRAASAVGPSLRIDLVWCREYTDGNLAQMSLRDSDCRQGAVAILLM